jgi:Uma2 family endonuclease
MATAALKQKRSRPFGPKSNGILMTPREFDRADFEDGWRYELINGVLVVSPPPLRNERDPNGELERWLRNYQADHPLGGVLDLTLHEETVRTRVGRRRADRVIWAGLGRLPRRYETPTIVAEFVSAGRRDRIRDYEHKRDEYLAAGVREYWVIDRFQRTLTVFTRRRGRTRRQVFRQDQTYTTELLPGFELPLGRLLELAVRWPEEEEEEL